MKITDLRARTVARPTTAMLRHNMGVHPGYLMRTIIEIFTDEGIVGLGEVGGGDQVGAFEKIKSRIIGLDPFDLELIKLKVLRSIYYLSNERIYGAIEIACLDIMGKACHVPMHQLLGGKIRDSIPMIAYLFWRYDRPDGRDDTRAEDLAEYCVELKESLGVDAMKLKAGVMDPMEEVKVLQLCREKLGDDFGLRIDPNGVWSVATAVRAGIRLEDIELQYYEDPSWGLEGMKAVREKVRVPLATNMYPNKFDELGPAIHMHTIDIILTDLHYWEGPRGVKDMTAVCRTFNLGVAMHSGAEFGIEMAAMLHTASTIPAMNMPGDAHYHYLTDDIIEGGLMKYEDGAIKVPEGYGLGVSLDEDKMKRYAKYYEEKGDYYARFHKDPRRPNWYPNVGGI